MSAPPQPTPAVPPRPSRSQEKGSAAGPSQPVVPPRPASKSRFNRSVSPNPDRFAPSPLNDAPGSSKGPLNVRRTSGHSATHLGHELERPLSVGLPGPGEEGLEYEVIEELARSPEQSRRSSASPEQTRTVGEDLKLHAPKPTMPAVSAKQRVAAVTRTDSDRAAAFGIGRPSSTEQHGSNRSLKKKASTTSQLSQVEAEDGIPEIGQRVPMYPNAGDVQAPSPAPAGPPSESGGRSGNRNSHKRSSSSRGFNDLPPGSYGLHGHGVAPMDKLEKAYYEKHPELLQKEHYKYLHDRPTDFSMSSEDLNKIVRDTAHRGTGLGTSQEYTGTPSEEVGFQATEEYASRMSRPASAAPKDLLSPKKSSFSGTDAAEHAGGGDADDSVIRVDDRGRHKGFLNFGAEESAVDHALDEGNTAPILAPDEVAKGRTPHDHPAVEPIPEPRESGFEDQPKSRPTSRPTSVYSPPPVEMHSTPLDDVQEYEPLFTDDEKSGKKPITAERLKEIRQRFPSRDIWEDAPNSVHATAEVSTPEVVEERANAQASIADVPPRENETPAQAFARKQEELAEKEAVTPDSFLHRQQKPPSYVGHQPHIAKEIKPHPSPSQRFPSRDVWEDTPDSLQYTATVFGPQSGKDTPPEEVAKTDAPGPTASAKPAVPARPSKQGSGDDKGSKPPVPERPARIRKIAAEIPQSSEPAAAAAHQKPPVPPRPMGGKIAALQAGFMSDLNKRLQLGPQAPKKEEPPAASEEAGETKEKVPLSDARKGRARGPQRRAPTRAAAPAATKKSTPPPTTTSHGKPVLSFSMTRTLFSIDEEGTITVESEPMELEEEQEPKVKEAPVETEVREVKVEAEPEPEPEAKAEAEAEAPNKLQEEPAKEPEPAEAEKDPATTTVEPKLESKSELEPEPAGQPAEAEKPGEDVGVDVGEPPKKEEQEEEHAVEAAEPPTVETETKTLATNTAGQPVLEETIEKKTDGDQVEAVEGVSTKD